MVILKYLKQLFGIWTAVAFTIIDVLAFIIGAISPDLYIPSWVFWAIAGCGLIIANIQLFSKQEEKLRVYELEEADINMNFAIGSMFFDNYTTSLGGKFVEYGLLSDTHVPEKADIFVSVEYENLGKEPGTPIMEIDYDKTSLPPIMKINMVTRLFCVLGNDTRVVEGRERFRENIDIPIAFTDCTAEQFIDAIRGLESITIFVKYRTKRVGGYGKYHYGQIDCVLLNFKELLRVRWEGIGQDKLAKEIEKEIEIDLYGEGKGTPSIQ